jgi:hypothetical protein
MKFIKPIAAVASAVLAVGLAPSAQAGDYKTFGPCWAWNNNFNDPNGGIHASFGTGSYPEMTVNFNFSSANLYGYPAICRGWHYGWSPTGDTLFPAQVSQLSSIPCQFSYSSGGSGMKGDFAYDTFLRWDSAKGNPQLEVMVWGGHNSWPIGNNTGSNVLWHNNVSYDIWEGYNSAAGYYVYSFVPNGSVRWPEGSLPTSGSLNIDIKVFYNWLQNNRSGDGRYSNNMYLNVVESGFEVVQGNGWAYINGWIDAQKGGGGSGTVGNGTYKIISRNSGKAMDAAGFGTANGTQIQQWTYASGNNQKWNVTNTGSDNYKIIGVQSGKSLDINSGSTANGTKVHLWDYWGGAMQTFKFASSGSGNYRITPNSATGSCLDVDGVSTANGAKVQLWQWGGGNNQQWSFQTP